MIELVLIVIVVCVILGFVIWATRQARLDGAAQVTADEQAIILGKIQAQREIEDELDQELRANPSRRATDRLRDEWSARDE